MAPPEYGGRRYIEAKLGPLSILFGLSPANSGAAASYISSIFARGGLMGSNLLYLSIEEILAPLLLKNAIKTPKKQKLSLMKLINEEFALLIR